MRISLLALAMSVLAAFLVVSPTQAADAPVYDIPRIEKFALDGDASDWADRGFRIDSMSPAMGAVKPAEAFSTRVRLGWNDDGLLMLVFWHDASWTEGPTVYEISTLDSMEVFFAINPASALLVKWFVAPGMDPAQSAPRTNLNDRRNDPDLLKLPADIKVARMATPDGCVLEALIPWRPLGVAPQMGTTCAFQVAFNDPEEGDYYPSWPVELDENPASLTPHVLRLSDKASSMAFEGLKARGGYVTDTLETLLTIGAAKSYAGKTAVIRDDEGRELARAEFAENGPTNALAQARFPMPPVGKPFKTLSIEVDGKRETSLDMQNADALRAWAFLHQELVAAPAAVFEGETFPTFEFAKPDYVEALIGPYTLKAAYYDKDRKPVTAASALGRYGAVVEVSAAGGKVYKRFMTLCRATSEQMSHGVAQAAAVMSDENIDPSDPRLQPQIVAWLQDGHGAAMASFFTDAIQTDRQWWVGFKRAFYGYDKRWPEFPACPRPIEGAPAPVVREGTLAEAGHEARRRQGHRRRPDEMGRRYRRSLCRLRRPARRHRPAQGLRHARRPSHDLERHELDGVYYQVLSGTLMMTFVDQGLVKLDDPSARICRRLTA